MMKCRMTVSVKEHVPFRVLQVLTWNICYVYVKLMSYPSQFGTPLIDKIFSELMNVAWACTTCTRGRVSMCIALIG